MSGSSYNFLDNDFNTFYDTGIQSYMSDQGNNSFLNNNNSGGSDSFFGDLFKDSENGGMFSNMLSLGQLGLNAYLGLKQLDVAEDTLAFQEEAFSKQYEANKALTNAELAWQYQAREDRLAGSGGEQVQIS